MSFQNDLFVSSLIGLIIGGGLLIFLQKYPGKPFKYEINEDEEERNEETEEKNKRNKRIQQEQERKDERDNYTVSEVLDTISEDSIVKKTIRLRKTFGIDEEVVRKAVRKTKEESKLGINSDDEINYLKVFDWLFFLIVIGCALYFVNYATQGQVYRVLYGLFPDEFETLNFHRPT